MMMFDLLAKRARVTPRQPALEDLYTGARYNYAEFNARAARFAAAALQLWKLTPGDRVAWLGHSRAEFFVMLFGCAKAGLILVALNWRLTTSELKGLVSDCTPTALIFGAEFAGSARRALADTFPSMALVAMDSPLADQHRYETDLEAVTPDLTPHPERDPDAPWYLLYTSGTTGQPKGVIQTFRMMLTNYLNIGLAVNLTSTDVLLNVLPLFYTAGINLYSSALFMVGGCVLVARHFEPEAAFQVLEARATVFFGVPPVTTLPKARPEKLSSALRRTLRASPTTAACGNSVVSDWPLTKYRKASNSSAPCHAMLWARSPNRFYAMAGTAPTEQIHERSQSRCKCRSQALAGPTQPAACRAESRGH